LRGDTGWAFTSTRRSGNRNGYNRAAVAAVILSALIPVLCVLLPRLKGVASFTQFIGCVLGFVIYALIMRQLALVARPARARVPQLWRRGGSTRAAPLF
jgi:cytosine/uracil/thiamine/allantoin permease